MASARSQSRGRTDQQGARRRSTSRSTSRPASQLYRVFIPQFDTVANDPLDPGKRYHDGIFVETNQQTGEGKLYHVTGDIISKFGMKFAVKDNHIPHRSARFFGITEIGTIPESSLGRVYGILDTVPKPTKQQGLDFWNKYEGDTPYIWVREDGERYGPTEQRRPIRKCNEWTKDAKKKLVDTGILKLKK
ncbi:hypothetical protein N7462_002891 [Penicillium macrosclerotiorum]|uniref:uncharacterized protein n=1 Tax=Penicillium macrosclerotiorum TaxID=303699 RepID=UPI0025477814|nr:uncharacterized protein N7462_002891 [Penicillium macrosclerotiorum]KAJ5688499.1 hypothetical protein N7462_002891 [Penicillium macrosclerotiorum]